jgi:hypothetical protein
VDELTKTGIQRALELPDAPVADDLAVNEAGSWVHDKLTVVRKYDPAFGTACQSWGEWFYVDGLAGSGVNRIAEEGGRLVWGSPVIALRAQPPFANCLFLEQDAARAAALDHRTAALADRRVVEQGEVNTNLLRVMRAQLRGTRSSSCLTPTARRSTGRPCRTSRRSASTSGNHLATVQPVPRSTTLARTAPGLAIDAACGAQAIRDRRQSLQLTGRNGLLLPEASRRRAPA